MGLRVFHLPAQHPPDHRRDERLAGPALAALIAVAIALGLWWAPWDAGAVERWYSRWLFPAWQRGLTTLSNVVGWAVLDALLGLAAIWLARLAWRPLRRAARGRRGRTALRSLAAMVAGTATLAVWFLLGWGLNYRRPPLADRLDHDPARIDVARVAGLAATAVAAINAGHGRAHAGAWPDEAALRAEMAPAFAEALRLLGLPDAIVPGRPKRTVLGRYFEVAGIAGFTNPFALEVTIVPSALPVERPALLLHEWAHLAGLAHEAEAGLAGWLAGVRGTDRMRYSAWLDLLPRLASALPRERARAVMEALAEGPRADYRAIAERLKQVRPIVRDVAWSGYERFLEANTVEEGLRSYDGVVGLVAGTTFDERWRPGRRR